MNWKRLLPCALALSVTLAVTGPLASAAAFPDVQNHWAKPYIEDMAAAGMFKGDDKGNFNPENQLTASEALALCARAVGVDENTGAEIADDRREDVDSILDGSQSWFYREFAIALETQILTQAELKKLSQSGALTQPIAKETLAIYLTRAMQLGPMSEKLSSYPLNFRDTASIRESAKPSVYLMGAYGIVQGDENNNFDPNGNVTRAVMATMLSRAVEFMENYGTAPDLPDYTNYAFQQGVIAAEPTQGGSGSYLLTLKDDFTGEVFGSVSLPADVKIYDNNMLSTASALRPGRHARVCLDNRGRVFAIRISDALDVLRVTVNGIEDNSLAVTVNGQGRILTMDRFTQVQIGSKSRGDRSLVDPSAGYTAAVCKLDDQGRLVALELDGGTHKEEGLISGYAKAANGSVSLQLTGFDGVNRTYSVPSGAAVTVNGLSGTLSSLYEGSYASLRVSNEDTSVAAATVDTLTQYIQGAVKSVSYSSDTNTITVYNLDTHKSTTYDISKTAAITYNGEKVLLRYIQKDYFVTLRLSGGDAVLIEAYPGSTLTAGTITDRVFSADNGSVTFVVTQEDGTKVNFKLDLSNLPDIERDDSQSSVDKLRVGDSVEVTVRYNSVTDIAATSQDANVAGTVNRIIQELSGYTLEMTLEDGEDISYTVSSSVAVTQNGKDATLSAIKPGYKLGLVVSGDQVSSIEIRQAVNSSNKLIGTAIYVNSSEKYIYLRAQDEAGNEEIITVNIPSGTIILDVNTGEELYLKSLNPGDALEINGAFEGTEFNAKIILKQ